MGVEIYHQGYHICKRCDSGTHPLDVPSEACGHSREENAVWVEAELVDKRDYDAAVARIAELEALTPRYIEVD